MQPSEALDFINFTMIAVAVFGALAGVAAFLPIIIMTWPKRRK